MLLRLRHAVLNGVGDALKASVSPEPSSTREISADRRTYAVGAMTAGASAAGNLSVKDLFAERDLFSGCARRHRVEIAASS
jgi:hypothetical protein